MASKMDCMIQPKTKKTKRQTKSKEKKVHVCIKIEISSGQDQLILAHIQYCTSGYLINASKGMSVYGYYSVHWCRTAFGEILCVWC